MRRTPGSRLGILALAATGCMLDAAGEAPADAASTSATTGGAPASSSSGATADTATSGPTGGGGASSTDAGVGGEGGRQGLGGSGGLGAGGAGGAPEPRCGDDVIDPGEECDGGSPCEDCAMVCPRSWRRSTIEGATATCYGRAGPRATWAASPDVCEASRAGLGIDEAVPILFATPDVGADIPVLVMLCGIDLAFPQTGCWIGASRVGTEFLWVSGEPFVYVDGEPPWSPNEPNDLGGVEDCAELYTDGNPARPMNDDFCSNSQVVICEIPPPGARAREGG